MWCIAFFHDAAGYLHIIEQMKELIKASGKKSYTLVMGRPNSAKLANFPEVCYFFSAFCFFVYFNWLTIFSFSQCEVFVYVSCAQTALLDSKDFLAPVITPFEAVLAFGRYTTLIISYIIVELIVFLMAWLQIHIINLQNFTMVMNLSC